ncbi:MAG: hypothetical protein K8W52_12020 [Deltaproteobacteria bacterium]|nr:hypothetical protein [Deltaproteobacteria bacterium]
MRAALAVVGLVGLGACGGHQHAGAGDDDSMFQCKSRSVSYIVTGGIAGDELGVAIDCQDAGPRVRRWVVQRDGARDESAKSLTPGEFDDIWQRVDGAGWRNIRDCDQAAGKGDPVYTFDAKDWNASNSFSCAGRGALPFPYGNLIDELDQAAAAITGHAHDDPGLDR